LHRQGGKRNETVMFPRAKERDDTQGIGVTRQYWAHFKFVAQVVWWGNLKRSNDFNDPLFLFF
jgi:hypothetical protein